MNTLFPNQFQLRCQFHLFCLLWPKPRPRRGSPPAKKVTSYRISFSKHLQPGKIKRLQYVQNNSTLTRQRPETVLFFGNAKHVSILKPQRI